MHSVLLSRAAALGLSLALLAGCTAAPLPEPALPPEPAPPLFLAVEDLPGAVDRIEPTPLAAPAVPAVPPAPPKEPPAVSSSVPEAPASSQPPPPPEKPSEPPSEVPVPPPQLSEGVLAGYYPGYAAGSGYAAEDLPADRLTHIHYAFAGIDENHRLTLTDPRRDLENFSALRRLKEEHPHLQTLISVGGWGHSEEFSAAAATASARTAFAESTVEFITEHGFDGVDLDWEFPVIHGGKPEDRQNFTRLLETLRLHLDRQGALDGRSYLLTFAGVPTRAYLGTIETRRAAELADYVFLMGYDLHGPWDAYADLTAPLYTPEEDSPQYKLSLDQGVSAWLDAGVPAGKLVLGMPFYGYLYTLREQGGLYSPFVSAKSIGYDRVYKNYLRDPSFTRHWHHGARVPYLTDGKIFLSYEDPDSIREKARYARSRGLLGLGAWELSHDRQGRLLDAAREGFSF